MKFLFSLTLIILTTFSVLAQTDEEKFFQAEEHLEFGRFGKAIELYKELYSKDTTNSNFAYKLGLTYYQAKNKRILSIPYLEQAIKNISGDYDPEFEFTARTAPSDALFYLGAAYHLNYEFDKALNVLNRFRMVLDPKREVELISLVDKKIEEIKIAQEAIQNPVDVEIENLGPNINTEFPDFSPAISADEKTLVFTSRRPGSTGGLKTNDDQFFEDIYISHKDSGIWSKPQQISNINSDGHEATISLSVDGSKLFVYRDDLHGKINHSRDGNIYISSNINGEWTKLTKMPESINTKSWETHASLTSDEKTLYFVSNKPGGIGGRDVYVTNKLPTGEWAEAKNLGTVVNTKYEEDGVFIHPDGKTLYFSSQGHKTMGGFDIFKTTLDKTTGFWSEPENIGYPLNTTDDDVFYVLSPDGKRAYYASSNQEDGFGEKDIYVTYLNGIKENCLVVVKGSITSENGSIPKSTEITVNSKEGDLIGIYKPNLKSGNYILILPENSFYEVVYSADDFKSEKVQIATPDSGCYSEINKYITLPFDVELPVTQKGSDEQINDFAIYNKGENTLNVVDYKKATSEVNNEKTIPNNEQLIEGVKDIIVLRNVFFDFDKATLRPESKKELEKLYNFLKDNPGVKAEIAGHTDAMGTVSYNKKLSQKRANSIVAYQIQKGINKSRLIAKGYGESQPIARNANPDGTDNPEGRQINRRIELRILDKSSTYLNVVEEIKVDQESKLTNSNTDLEEKKKLEINKNYKVKYKGDTTELIIIGSNSSNNNEIPFPVPISETNRLSEFYSVQLSAFIGNTYLEAEIEKLSQFEDLWIYELDEYTKISSKKFNSTEEASQYCSNLKEKNIDCFVVKLPINAKKIQ